MLILINYSPEYAQAYGIPQILMGIMRCGCLIVLKMANVWWDKNIGLLEENEKLNVLINNLKINCTI